MKTNQNEESYNEYVEAVTPKNNVLKNSLNAFWVGGTICVIGEIINNVILAYSDLEEADSMSYTSIVLILVSVLLTGFNLYKGITIVGGAGALVPITGFANSVASPTIEYQKEGEVFGKGVKLFTIAGPVILFGIITSFVLGLIYYIAGILNFM